MRPSRIHPLGSAITERVVMLTQTDPPAEATHSTSAMMAKVVDISASSVQRIWRAHGLQPHRWIFHFTPTSASWLNAVEEGFFAKLTKRRLKRGVFLSVVDLQAAINRFVLDHDAKPFTWTADPDKIIQAVRRGHQVLDSIH